MSQQAAACARSTAAQLAPSVLPLRAPSHRAGGSKSPTLSVIEWRTAYQELGCPSSLCVCVRTAQSHARPSSPPQQQTARDQEGVWASSMQQLSVSLLSAPSMAWQPGDSVGHVSTQASRACKRVQASGKRQAGLGRQGWSPPGVEPQRVCEGVLRNASPRCFDSLPVFTAAAEFQTHDVGRAPRGVPQQAPGNAPNKAPQLDRAHVRSTLTLLSLTPQHQGPAARVSMFPFGRSDAKHHKRSTGNKAMGAAMLVLRVQARSGLVAERQSDSSTLHPSVLLGVLCFAGVERETVAATHHAAEQALCLSVSPLVVSEWSCSSNSQRCAGHTCCKCLP